VAKITASVDYETILEKHPEFAGVIHQRSWEHIGATNAATLAGLEGLWVKNLKANKDIWDKRNSIKRLTGIGKNKAIIGIGAGQSLNKNINTLRYAYENMRDDCIFIASNHQLKPLIQQGIIPDYVILTDASDVVEKQLTEDIPSVNTVLLTGMHCSPKVLHKWVKQKRPICFYLTENKAIKNAFQQVTGRNPNVYSTLQGGNVLNTLWTLSLKFFGATAFITVGNDLSYELHDDVEIQRKDYYADGDYSTNLGTGRDEAGKQKKWLAFDLTKKIEGYDYRLHIVGTTGTLWTYKVWIESHVLANIRNKVHFHYFNCSEGGILGVMARDESNTDNLQNKDNWFMLDSVCPRWHTTLLEDTLDKVKFARKQLIQG